jgi:hypothetical protein
VRKGFAFPEAVVLMSRGYASQFRGKAPQPVGRIRKV